MEHKQVLPLQVRVDLGVMATKVLNTQKTGAASWDAAFCQAQDTLFWGESYPSAQNSVSIF